ncbi:Putative KfrA protein (fragment) (plasmid) [Cupriavidus taiwanensis]|uniref:KfrA protein n=1 Tax=Cupriavidus taiwanensis TaxID=164546 RepID=A0A7Z7JJK1_9BURK
MALAQERAEASERRSLRELDAERTARQKSERTAEELRGELVAARSEARDAAVAQAEVRAKLEAQAAALADRLTTAEQAQRKSVNDLDTVQAELAAAQRRAERAEAEAALVRQLLAELRVGPPERNGGGGRRRKADGPGPTEQQAQCEKQAQEPGVPTVAQNPDDGNDSSDDDDDSQQ